jgi:hypothetical protein
MRAKKPSFFRIGLILFVAALVIGCSLPSFGSGSAATDTPVPTITTGSFPSSTEANTEPPPTMAPPTVQPTAPPPPTATSQPKSSPTPVAKDFYTEEFDGSLSDWGLYFTSGDDNLAEVYTDNDRLTFFLDGEDIYAYLMYESYYYTDVMVTAVVENRGFNNNNVSLVCRYDPEEGWYEYNIANNGLYDLLFYDANTGGYEFLANGGSTSINMGKAVNEYTMICEEENLILYVNGQETKRYAERKFALREGMIGISVSSFDVFPIEVDVLSLTISPP